MFNASQFRIPSTPPDLVGGVVTNDVNNRAWLFSLRFGQTWRRIPKSNNVFVLFDKLHDNVCFTYCGDEIAMYKGLSRAEFIRSWDSDKALVQQAAQYFNVDERYKYAYLQIEELLKL